MEQITITEALSEINLIKKKITAKQQKITNLLLRVEHLPDQFISEGGSEQVINNENQAIMGLTTRLLKIRAKISAANLANSILIGDIRMSIHDWLVWKREIVKDHLSFVSSVNRAVKLHLDTASKSPQVYKDEAGNVQVVKTKINLNYANSIKHESDTQETLEKLDGQLSLKNATIVIDL